MTTKKLRQRAADAVAECEARLVWSATVCAAKAAELAESYRTLDFGGSSLADRELRDEQGRLVEARLDLDQAKRWEAELRERETADGEAEG